MRSRSRSEYSREVVPAQYRYTENVNGTVSQTLYSSPSSFKRKFKQESMSDENKGLHVGIKPCIHTKVFARGGIVRVQKITNVDKEGRKTWIDTYQWTEPDISGSPDVTVSISNQQAVQNAMNGVLSSGTLAPVFFSELPELKGTFNELRSAEFGRKKFANKFLAYKFGIAPFISDLKTLYDGHDLIKAHIKKVNSRQGVPQKIIVPSGSITGSYSYKVPSSSTGTSSRSEPWRGSRKTIVKLLYTRRLEQGDAIRAALDYYGAHILAIGWEKLPYSFVADWFFDFGGILDLLEPKWQVPCTRVLSSCNVTKASLSIPLVNWDTRADVAVNVGSKEIHYFQRDAAPVTFNSLLNSGFNLNRASIGAALYLQKK